ncbi:MAG: 16S rRNA (cytidine(1402)-2'-O)-methyltransferase [Chitinophagales bacterium]|nr:16S rRNA (cytidine(1402)-2'-O)-methyltransferase [Chitinophagales bacterium]MDW8427765.1 16S rRNA (cytidine(1402)-2'-O)-methyltransferase [Chitinophagales bacterium]
MLYVVPTPIGNLGDMTLRALQVLQTVDVVLAENPRHSSKLLRHYQIKTKVLAYHQHNEHRLATSLVRRMIGGERMALISDAGTPCISDAGYLLVRHCIEAGVSVSCLPGATAFVPALVMSGLPAHEFLFCGFLPSKKGRRQRLQQLAQEPRTLILYEAPHRLLHLLEDLVCYFGAERQVCLCREISKVHEQAIRMKAAEAYQWAAAQQLRGEWVIVVAGAEKS